MKNYAKGIQRRMLLLFAAGTICFSLLYIRIGVLASNETLMQTAQNQSKYTVTAGRIRGGIYDCNLQPLVNAQAKTVNTVLPSAENLIAVLDGVPYNRRESVRDLLSTGKPFALETDEPLSATGILSFLIPQRYTENQLAPHIIGYLDSEGNGVTGLEKSYQTLLGAATEEIQVVYTLNGLQRAIAGIEPDVRQKGDAHAGIVLSIDKNIQIVIEEIGAQMLERGAIVVMDPYTGAIKASASFPDFSPETLADSVSDTEGTPMINRAFLPYNVGSTFKIVTAAAALEAGISYHASYCCTGSIDIGGQVFRCHNRSGHGEVDMLDAMMESCNPYFIQLGMQVGGKALLEMAERFGFGQSGRLAEGMSFSAGTLPSAEELQNPAAVANLSFGQGALTASPIQIARMVSAVVNGGYLVYPTLIVGETMDGIAVSREADTPPTKILSTEVAAQVQSYLIHCVMVNSGQNALPQAVTAGGKTATAQTGVYDEQKDEIEQGWFAGFFPAVNPEYVVVVLAEGAGFGNTTASPVFAAIADGITALTAETEEPVNTEE